MAALKSSMILAFVLATVGLAAGAPARHEENNTVVSKRDPQLDPAALFRSTSVGECAAIRRQVATQGVRGKDARRARSEKRATLASAGCTVVWSD